MAKPSKNKNGKSARKSKPVAAPSRALKTSPVRNTTVPKPIAAARRSNGGSSKPITRELIAERAYFISISGNGGSEHDNWVRAERELRGI